MADNIPPSPRDAGILAALTRAAERARREAWEAGLPYVIYRDGQVVEVPPPESAGTPESPNDTK